MKLLGLNLPRAAPLLAVFAAMACGQGMGAGGCGPALDADKIAAQASKEAGGGKAGADAAAAAVAARAKADAIIEKGAGYKKDGYPDSQSGFSGGDGSLPGSPKSEFARLAQSLPPTPENQKLIQQAMGQETARGGAHGSTDLAGNGGYVTVAAGKDGKPTWQWNAYDAKHAAPKGFEKPYVSPSGSSGSASPAAADASAAATAAANPALQAPPGYNGCWPKPPPLNHINLGLMGGNGNRRVVDSTPIVCGGSYCSAVGFSGRNCCPLRPEGDKMRVKCEGEVLGRNSAGQIGPRWMYKGNGGVETHPENPFLAFGYGNGWVGACSNISPVCNWIEVKNHEDPKPAAAKGSGGGGSGGSSSPSKTAAKDAAPASSLPAALSTSTASGADNLESLIPVIPEVEPAH